MPALKKLILGHQESDRSKKKPAAVVVNRGEEDVGESALVSVPRKRARFGCCGEFFLVNRGLRELDSTKILVDISPGVALLHEAVTPEMFEEARRMSLLEKLLVLFEAFSRHLNIVRMFQQESTVAFSNADSIYAELERVQKSSTMQINEMEVELNVS
ncbi:hypothetical protein Pint_32968 [Pistacia integerrima]|uniref:Uncharacterized protein n=1 Tax=Pistacia integerrima TaxID=434235 RepID=A0ACC0X442_9ROSI|nr:hypothetical protein Pint_32968 [Pistacia integerrima]